MGNGLVLQGLLIVSLVLSVLLVLISAGATGSHLATLQYQRASGVNGIRQIQAWKNLRTHGNGVCLGLVFIVVTVMLLAGAPEIWRQWVNRVLFTLLMMTFTGSSVLDWLGDREQMRLLLSEEAASQLASVGAAADAEALRRSDLQATADSYRQMAEESVARLETAAELARAERGESPLEAVAAVVAEHSSPVSPAQQATADVATMRARLVAAKKGVGLDPEADPDANESAPRGAE
jgi:hypothetical protein